MCYKNEYQKRAHGEVEQIFRELLPEAGLHVREEQIRLCQVKFANHPHAFCMRRPDCKIHTLFTFILSQMCTQLFIDLIMGSLSKQILIHLCDHTPGSFFFLFHMPSPFTGNRKLVRFSVMIVLFYHILLYIPIAFQKFLVIFTKKRPMLLTQVFGTSGYSPRYAFFTDSSFRSSLALPSSTILPVSRT